MRIGILTGGGDCPGLNAVIRAIVRKGIDRFSDEFLGIMNGWAGLIDKSVKPIGKDHISGILPKGGTILGTSRTNPYKIDKGVDRVFETMKSEGLEALIAIGGEDTLGVANKLHKAGMSIIGVPKTIDNDLSGTDYTFGFDTATQIVTEAIDRLHTTAESHNRVMVVEVMGRHSGWIATIGGIAGGADCILIPEFPFSVEDVVELIKKRQARGRAYSIIVVAEGAKPKDIEQYMTKDKSLDAFGHVKLGGIGDFLAKEIEKRTGAETRMTNLGHVQRGGTPTAYDRVLGTRYGIRAIDMVHEGKFGRMAALQGNKIVDIPLSDAVGTLKTVDKEFFEVAKVFFG
ncbi:6-phosphofructokinase [bacterium]|nr:6-phosphofructokinase [bacterium]